LEKEEIDRTITIAFFLDCSRLLPLLEEEEDELCVYVAAGGSPVPSRRATAAIRRV
jgi:hypothetical protein